MEPKSISSSGLEGGSIIFEVCLLFEASTEDTKQLKLHIWKRNWKFDNILGKCYRKNFFRKQKFSDDSEIFDFARISKTRQREIEILIQFNCIICWNSTKWNEGSARSLLMKWSKTGLCMLINNLKDKLVSKITF